MPTNRFATLSASLFTRQPAAVFPAPYLVHANVEVAALIGLSAEELETNTFLQTFSGNTALADGTSLATVYSGHQFGVWAGQLGDGRALLIGDRNGWEIQLKGSGKTPYSRMGDGYAVLRSSIREYLCSEAMHALGIPTTRALCVIGSDMPVFRETTETAAVVARLAPSFIRFGHMEHAAHHGLQDELRQLLDFVIHHYYPHCAATADPVLALLQAVCDRTAQLMADWQAVGFMHGVMNTDNMSILGLTLDYGPFGFMETFDVNHICNHSDTQGRYAYARQPEIAHWNLYALAQALVAVYPQANEQKLDEIREILRTYPEQFGNALLQRMRCKLGLQETHPEDVQLVTALIHALQQARVDYTIFFRKLAEIQRMDTQKDEVLLEQCVDRAACGAWLAHYRARLQQELCDDATRKQAMNCVNPKFVLRNHLAQRAIERAQQKDFSEIDQLLKVLRRPFDEQPEYQSYSEPAPEGLHIEVSCSS